MNAVIINLFLSIFASAAAFCCIVQMTNKTNHAVRIAVIVVAIGLLGQALGLLKAEWASWMDTLLLGGIGAFLLANRRIPVRFKCRMCESLSIAVSVVTVVWVALEWARS